MLKAMHICVVAPLRATRSVVKKSNGTFKHCKTFHQRFISVLSDNNNNNNNNNNNTMEEAALIQTPIEAQQNQPFQHVGMGKTQTEVDMGKTQGEGDGVHDEKKKRRGRSGGNRSRNNSENIGGNRTNHGGRNCQQTNHKTFCSDAANGQQNQQNQQKYGRSPHFKNDSKLPEVNFEGYISHEECAEGLKAGTLIQGTCRINPRSYQDAYINGENIGERDINIVGVKHRNRAFPGDIIAVELLPREEWKKTREGKDEVEEKTKTSNEVEEAKVSDDFSYYAKTGKVVYIIERKHKRVAAGHLQPYRNNMFGFALFSPVDNRIPRMMIQLDECPTNFAVRPNDYENTLFIARVVSWYDKMAFAHGEMMRSLGEAGHIGPETEAILLENDIDGSDFEEDVVRCLPDGDTWEITAKELAKRKDLRGECIFTIDPPTARDLDDALSCKKLGPDLYEVGVHIADVSHFIKESNALDKSAMERATSVYLANKVIPMLPQVLCEKLCSLNPGVDRLAYSVIWNMKSDGTIVKEWFGRSVICSATKLSYEQAQQMIDHTNNTPMDASEYPDIHGGHALQKICSIVKNMYGISSHMRKNRFDSGALKIDMPKLAFALDEDTGLPIGCSVHEQRNSNEMIEEFMLCANMAVGHRIYKFHPKEAILRLHPAPIETMLADLDDLCKRYEIPFDIRNSASINASLQKIVEFAGPENAEYMYSALTLMCAKPFQNAVYFCTGSFDEEEMYRHYALNIPIYTHFTSPIRRYPDVLVHRLLTASLDIDFKIKKDLEELQIIADTCNTKKWAAKKASEASSLLYLGVYVKECGPLTEKGVVVGILNKAIDVLSVRLGTTNRVYMDQLQLSKHEFKKTEELKPQMTLFWKDNKATEADSLDDRLATLTKQFEQRWENKGENQMEDDGSIMQELTIFSPVELILCVKHDPTKILASIRNPHEVNVIPTHGL